MKLHLPIVVLTALLGTFVAHAIDVPSDYEQISLSSSSDLNNYTSNTEDDKYAFFISTDVSFTPTTNPSWTSSSPLVTGGSHIFTSANGNTPASISFSRGLMNVFQKTETLSFDSLLNLIFSNHTNSNGYGAIYLSGTSKLNVSHVDDNNKNTSDVIFSNNVSTRSTNVYGGAISVNSANAELSSNGQIKFESNAAINNSNSSQYSYPTGGGAIYIADGSLNIDKNSDVSFIGNYVKTGSVTSGSGGAIEAVLDNSIINISNNANTVEFSKNYVHSSNATASGGAIQAETLNIYNNGIVNFDSNYIRSNKLNDFYNSGGAICVGTLSIINNQSVHFQNNYISCKQYARGAAIYSDQSISIVGNGSVIFEKNYEKPTNGAYILRSIYINPYGDTEEPLVLAARTEGSIEFYDSVYVGTDSGCIIKLNNDYKDAGEAIQKAKGDIVFSGKYTADHLKEIKGGTAGTATEIANSRTSELLNTVNLYGGTLRVEDKAVLKTHAINVVAGSNATMKVSDATVDATGYDIKVNDSAVLVIGGTDGSTKITAKNINIEDGATLSLTRTEVATENVAITLSSADSVSIYNDKIAGIVSSSNLNIAGGATLKADGAHLSMDGGILNFLATTENKTNLVLTLGAEYDPNSQIMLFSDVDTVKFLQDNITATTNSAMVTLNASDYFIGDWVNDKTILVYDNGNIYVSGVNVVIPEPATTTLSLLALAALAARRRRK